MTAQVRGGVVAGEAGGEAHDSRVEIVEGTGVIARWAAALVLVLVLVLVLAHYPTAAKAGMT